MRAGSTVIYSEWTVRKSVWPGVGLDGSCEQIFVGFALTVLGRLARFICSFIRLLNNFCTFGCPVIVIHLFISTCSVIPESDAQNDRMRIFIISTFTCLYKVFDI